MVGGPRAGWPPSTTEDHAFLAEVGDVVVKPTRGEQGKGITVGVEGPEAWTRRWPGRASTSRGARSNSEPPATTCDWW